jgi:structural maintenance of chromosome 1
MQCQVNHMCGFLYIYLSRSWEYKEDYDRLKALYDQAVEANAHALHKKRGIAMEAKQYRQQKEEAENFTRLVQERQEMSARYLLWKLYHVEQKTEEMQQQVDQRRTAADGATEEQVIGKGKGERRHGTNSLLGIVNPRRIIQVRAQRTSLGPS